MQFNNHDVARFWTLVERPLRGKKGCWLWTGERNHRGYGRFKLKGRTVFAHRLAYAIINEIAYEKDSRILHDCDNPSCVSPYHLKLGNQHANVHDMIRKGRAVFPQAAREIDTGVTFADDDCKAAWIRRKYARGHQSYRKLAKRFGLSVSEIKRIVRPERAA